jgi:maltooligosyltrehalose trehalohydrolase
MTHPDRSEPDQTLRAPTRSFALSAGATLTAPTRTRFRFWAPDVAKVALDIDGAPVRPMQTESGGWHSVEAPCGVGTHYRYRIGPDLAVPDPASRAQAGDVGGFSIVVDPGAYRWRNDSWRGRPWREAIVYETHVGLAGGFRGLEDKLPALADLGITAIELMPIAEFPGARNWGYDGVLPYAPTAAYGSPDDLKALIDRAHDLGLMVLQDVVYNHFGPQGNHLNSYASAFFHPDLHTPWGPAIDFSNPVVRGFFIENALYWLEEYRFDGLRLDAVHAIPDRGWLLELAETVRSRITDRAVHLVLENDDNDAGLLEDAYTAQWNDDAHHAAHVLITGEAGGYYSDYAAEPAAMMARCLAEGFAFQGETSDYRGGAERGRPSAHLPPSRFVFFLQNHDQIGNRALGERLAAIADPDALRVGVALLLLSPQIPLLFMGEERGAREPFLYFTAYEGELAEAVKQGRRKEFGRFPAFATPEAQRQIPDPNKTETFERSRPDFDAGHDWAREWLGFYRDLMALRRTHIVPRLDSARTLAATALGPTALSVSWSFGDGAVLSIAANFGTAPVDMPTPVGACIFACGVAAEDSLRRLPPRSFVAGLVEPA